MVPAATYEGLLQDHCYRHDGSVQPLRGGRERDWTIDKLKRKVIETLAEAMNKEGFVASKDCQKGMHNVLTAGHPPHSGDDTIFP